MDSFPFCPNPICVFHDETPDYHWFSRYGSYSTLAFGSVTRFICSSCGKTFSSQTFSTQYYAKKNLNLEAIFERHCGAQSGRSIGRALNLSCATIQNRLDRLARQSIALHSSIRPLINPHEPICIDGFVSFDRSQYFPNELTFSITAQSRFILELSHASHRRAGTRTPSQNNRASELYTLWKPEKNAVRRSFRDILDSLSTERPPTAANPLVLITDENPEYVRALDHHPLFETQDETHRVAHITINSRLPRTWQNPLFASNYLDRELRKDCANHHRETTCFTRNVTNGLSRLVCYIMDHNYRKRFLIKAGASDRRAHAEAAGIEASILHVAMKDFFFSRAFFTKCRLSKAMERIWRKEYLTPGKAGKDYLPAFALA